MSRSKCQPPTMAQLWPVCYLERVLRAKTRSTTGGTKDCRYFLPTANGLRGEAGHQWRSAGRSTANSLGVRAGRGEHNRAPANRKAVRQSRNSSPETAEQRPLGGM